MAKNPRDSQRQKLYNAEERLSEFWGRKLTPEHLEAVSEWQMALMNSAYVARVFPKAAGFPVVTKYSNHRAKGGARCISYPTHAVTAYGPRSICRPTVIHEISHAIAERMNHLSMHDPAYARTYILMMALAASRKQAEALMRVFDEGRVKYLPIAAEDWPTEEESRPYTLDGIAIFGDVDLEVTELKPRIRQPKRGRTIYFNEGLYLKLTGTEIHFEGMAHPDRVIYCWIHGERPRGANLRSLRVKESGKGKDVRNYITRLIHENHTREVYSVYEEIHYVPDLADWFILWLGDPDFFATMKQKFGEDAWESREIADWLLWEVHLGAVSPDSLNEYYAEPKRRASAIVELSGAIERKMSNAGSYRDGCPEYRGVKLECGYI